jgi:energy-coupling factor transport system ATP-binding protein
MIRFENVSFSYAGQTAGGLHELDFSVRDGECILLCGRSGCGKTTVTRLVNGLIPSFFDGKLSGKVSVGDMNIRETPMYQIARRVGSVFQNPRTQFFNVDTDSEIAFGMENEAVPPEELRRRVEQSAEDLRIQSLRGRNIFALSGGEKQKIAFASIYAMNPDVYVLDEPSSNLDRNSINELQAHLKFIKAQGKTILIAEHRLYYLMELIDRALYLEKGRIADVYTAGDLTRLSDTERASRGLRATDLRTVRPCAQGFWPGRARVQPGRAGQPGGQLGRTEGQPEGQLGQPILEVRDVTLHNQNQQNRQNQPVLKHLTLSAARGEVIGIIGHNGVGKTSFSRALCGLHKHDDGHILWDGQAQNWRARLRRSYLVMQDVNYELFAESVEKECVLGIKNPDYELALSTLEELDLLSYRDCHPNTLSGGQKQRVVVAVSMVCGRELLVFDEPTSGLDYDSMARVAELIKRLASLGRIVFVVTHDYEFVCRSCSRILHLGAGGQKEDLTVCPAHEKRVKTLFGIE